MLAFDIHFLLYGRLSASHECHPTPSPNMITEGALWDHLFPFSLSRAPVRANNREPRFPV